ncbi:MAG: four helix bundle protein [Gemmataceae bacterium]
MIEAQTAERVDLRVRTKQFAVRIIRRYGALPKQAEADVIGRQVLRSGTSVGANFREAHRARSDAEFVSKLGDCLKELEETSYWLEPLVDAGLVPPARVGALQEECEQLLAILTTICKKVKARKG